MSGPEAIEIVDALFVPRRGRSLKGRRTHSLTYGAVKDGDATIDEVLACVMRGPRSYTGDDIVELYCHGGPAVLERALNLLVERGCRLAAPGEFTRRAFLNGRIDLTQAEAVADLIAAPTDLARQAAVVQLEGRLRDALREIHESLVALLADIDASIDFPEDVGEGTVGEVAVAGRLSLLRESVVQLLRNADAGKILHDGYRVAIAGKPNSGKSSILNRLAREERALVTDIPGTTRDTLEADVNVEGFPVRFIDTAGLRRARGKVERHGIARAEKTIRESDMILWIADISRRPFRADMELPPVFSNITDVIWVWNKYDLSSRWPSAYTARVKERWRAVEVSALTGEGISELHNALAEILRAKRPAVEDQVVVLRARHRDLLKRTCKALSRALDTLARNPLPELVAMDVRDALNAVGELTGEVTSEDLLDKIFSDFCIGK